MNRRKNPTYKTRAALARVKTYKDRAKILRAYKPEIFSAESGFDLRSPGSWTPQQRAAVTRNYNNIEKIVDEREEHETEIATLRRRTKRIRPYFGDEFKPVSGFDLREIESWTPKQKKRLTEYYKVMAPNLAADNVVTKRYRRADHMEAAILRSGQEEFLPGQTAVAFGLDVGESLKIEFNRKGEIMLDRDGVPETKLDFNMVALQDDPLAEIERVLNQTTANVFRIQTGPTAKSYDVFTRASIGDAILQRIDAYSKLKPKTRQFDSQHYSKWLFGLYAYPTATVRKQQKVSRDHRAFMAEKKKADDKQRREDERKYTVTEVKLGRRLRKGERVTGRKGRVK